VVEDYGVTTTGASRAASFFSGHGDAPVSGLSESRLGVTPAALAGQTGGGDVPTATIVFRVDGEGSQSKEGTLGPTHHCKKLISLTN